MDLYRELVSAYNNFLGFFPPDIHWVVTLAIILAIIVLFVNLIKENILFALLLIPVVPALWPVVTHFFGDLAAFFVYLLDTVNGP
jgi:hypothetical protein